MQSLSLLKISQGSAKSAVKLLAVAATTLTMAFSVSAPATAAPMTDAQIIAIYIQVNDFDIETALLGRSLAQSDAVRKLAVHVSTDHMGVRDAAFGLATTCKVALSLPDERSAAALDHSKTMSELVALKGAEFDKAYLKHEVAFHQAAIDAVRTGLLPSATCPELKVHFNSVLPAFEHHLAETQTLAAQMLAH